MPERARFQPRFTVAIVYFTLFFVLYAALLVLPALLEVVRPIPADPAAEEALRQEAFEAAREAARGRLPLAVVATLVTVGGLAWARVLPGMRGPAEG